MVGGAYDDCPECDNGGGDLCEVCAEHFSDCGDIPGPDGADRDWFDARFIVVAS